MQRLNVTPSASIQMQTQISNLMVIQNLQEYLKYLILTTSVEPTTNPPVCFGLCSAEQPMQQHHEAAAVMEEEKHTSEEPEEDSADLSADEEAEIKRKKSQKLFSLMQKKLKAPAEQIKGCQNKTPLLCHEKICMMANSKKVSKDRKIVCGHPDREHYAKGLCGSCYLRHGRTKKPWNCPHDKLYALGLCQKCYANKYNKKKKVNDAPPTKHTCTKLFVALQGSNALLNTAFGGCNKIAPEQKRTPCDAGVVVKMENN